MSLLFGGFEGPVRTVLVGVLAYVGLILVLRTSGKQTLSKMDTFDLLVTVALGSTVTSILLSRDVPLLDGLVAFILLAGRQRVITEASLRSRTVARLVKSEPPRVRLPRGSFMTPRQERVLETELQAAMRARGLAGYEDTHLVVLETDRSLTAVAKLPDAKSAASEALADLARRE